VSNPNKILPLFPSKKQANSVLKKNDIEQRRLMLDDFLKGIQQRFNDNMLFHSFLNVDNDCFQYKGSYAVCREVKKEVGMSKNKMLYRIRLYKEG
jgi:hypothetical protein